jgi:hypothetical protein
MLSGENSDKDKGVIIDEAKAFMHEVSKATYEYFRDVNK